MPIRVLQVVTYMQRGGLETMLMNYYRNIDRSKVQFDFLVHRDFEADYDREILELGGKIHRLPVLNPFGPGYLKKLDQFYKEHPEYTIVHSHLDCLAGIPLKYAKKNGVPVRLAHAHNSNQTKNLKYPIKLFCRRNITKNANHLFACSEEAGKWMFQGAPFEVLHNAIDAERYIFNPVIREKMRREFGISQDTMVVGHVGRFMPQKNHSFLLDIFAEVHRRQPNSRLLLVGEGDLEGEAKQKAKALGLGDAVIFAGVRSDVPALLQAMDAFVLPSLYEGLPLVMVEAQAAGLPCLISDKVPIECEKTQGLVRQIALDAGAAEWADEAISCARIERRNTFQQIRDANYDIRENAEKLERFYLKIGGGEKTNGSYTYSGNSCV